MTAQTDILSDDDDNLMPLMLRPLALHYLIYCFVLFCFFLIHLFFSAQNPNIFCSHLFFWLNQAQDFSFRRKKFFSIEIKVFSEKNRIETN